MKDYLTQFNDECEELAKIPCAFKGVLSQYNLEGLSEKELIKIFYKEGIYINRDPLYRPKFENISFHRERIDEKEDALKDFLGYMKFFGLCGINPILYHEIFSYSVLVALQNLYFAFWEYNDLLENTLKFKLNKIEYLQNEINKIFKKIDKKIQNKDDITTLIWTESYSLAFRKNNFGIMWLSGVVRKIDNIKKLNSDSNLEDFMLRYLTDKGFDSTDALLSTKYSKYYYKWLKVELLAYKFDLLKTTFKNLLPTENQSKEDDHSLLIENDQMFLKALPEILKDEDDISIFEEILELYEDKDRPFFTAIYNYFGGKDGFTKQLIDCSQKVFFKIVNKSYNLNMSRLYIESTKRANDLRKKFKKIVDKPKNQPTVKKL